jgi:DNA repair protein RecO (recombination protein O)
VPKTPEPRAWSVISGLLDALDQPGQPRSARILLAEFGLGLLAALGWGLDFQRCVSCSKACEAERAAFVDAARGGLVCRACGGAHQRLDAPLRSRLAAHAVLADSQLLEEDVEETLRLVESALRAHVGEV